MAAIGFSVRYSTVVVGGSQRRASMNNENCSVPATVPRNSTASQPRALNDGSSAPPALKASTGSSAATAKAMPRAVTKSGP